MARTPHTGVWEGKRVKVMLLSGEEFVDKFWGKKGKYRLFQNKGKIAASQIKRFMIWKGKDPSLAD